MKKKRLHPWCYLAIVLLLTWIFWIPACFLPPGSSLIRVLHYIGGVMPVLVTLFVIHRREQPAYRQEYWKRLYEVKRIPPLWALVIFLSVPALTAVGYGLDVLLGGPGGTVDPLIEFLTQPLSLLPFAVFMLLFGPLPEEMAWRGYGLDKLQERHNALVSSLILGVVWTVWHLPLFWMNGSYQHSLGVGTTRFWLYMVDKIPITILMTWIFNNTQRSTLSAVLFHFMINFIGELVDLTCRAEGFMIASYWVAALIITLMWGKKARIRKPPDGKTVAG